MKQEERKWEKNFGIAILLLICGSILVGTVAALAEPFEPAPNSGDSDPDCSGFDRTETHPWVDDGSFGDAVGTASYSGDGVSDSSGF